MIANDFARPPLDRITYWQTIINKIEQFARDHDFETALIWARESDPGAGAYEHLHVLVHVEPRLFKRFAAIVAGWFGEETALGPADVDVRHAGYRIRWTSAGKRRSAITYVTKNSPQAAHRTDRSYRKGGPILGKRVGCSRNIDQAARDRNDAETNHGIVFAGPSRVKA